MTDERRKHRRKAVSSYVRVFHPEIGSFDAVTNDISNGGILIEANEESKKLSIADEVKVIFLNSGDVAVIFNMKVAHNSNNGMGMELLSCEKNGTVFPISDLRELID